MLPSSMYPMENFGSLISTFVNDLTGLLIFEDVQMREAAREALGFDLEPLLHCKVLRYCNELVAFDSCFISLAHWFLTY